MQSVKHSFIATAIFAAVFLLAKVFNLEKDIDLRFVNYVVAFCIAYAAVKKVFERNNHEIEYYTTFMIGVTTVTLAQLWYSILFFIYLLFDNDMVVYLNSVTPHNIIAPRLSIAVI